MPFKFVASRLQSLSDIVIPCVIVFGFSHTTVLLFQMFYITVKFVYLCDFCFPLFFFTFLFIP